MAGNQTGGIDGTIGIQKIEGVASASRSISGSVSPGGSGRKEVISNTTEAWNAKPRLKSVKDVIYVYTDYKVVDGVMVPGMKVGDGMAFVVDLPFVTAGTDVTQEQIDFWNDKCSAMIDPEDPEHLILYTDQR